MTVTYDEREYARLLGYPWGTLLEGEVKDRADQAAAWYQEHGRPQVYCVTAGNETVTAITAGAEVDVRTEKLWALGHVDEAYFLDRFAVAVVEGLAAELGPHRKPGTGGMPFAEQFRLFDHVAPIATEMEMLSSGMLKPKNSLLVVSVAGEDAAMPKNPCTRCDLRGCSYRRTTL